MYLLDTIDIVLSCLWGKVESLLHSLLIGGGCMYMGRGKPCHCNLYAVLVENKVHGAPNNYFVLPINDKFPSCGVYHGNFAQLKTKALAMGTNFRALTMPL